MSPLKTFLKLIKSSEAITIDESALLTCWTLNPSNEERSPDSALFEVFWANADHRYRCSVTRESLENGHVSGDAFTCFDVDGRTTKIRFYKTKNLLSGEA